MKIVVCLKQVPDTNQDRIDPVTGTLIREGVPSIINPEDKHALEEALRIKDANGAHVTVLSMGPMQAEAALREAMAMGADEAILISDRAFAGADTLATSHALAGALKKLEYDIIFAGRQAIDGDTAQVGPEIAEHLGLPQVTYVQKVEVAGDSLKVTKGLEDGYEVLTAPEDFSAVRDELQAKGYEFISADVKLLPQTTTKLTEEEQLKFMNRLVDMLEDDDDVQNIYHNWEIEE